MEICCSASSVLLQGTLEAHCFQKKTLRCVSRMKMSQFTPRKAPRGISLPVSHTKLFQLTRWHQSCRPHHEKTRATMIRKLGGKVSTRVRKLGETNRLSLHKTTLDSFEQFWSKHTDLTSNFRVLFHAHFRFVSVVLNVCPCMFSGAHGLFLVQRHFFPSGWKFSKKKFIQFCSHLWNSELSCEASENVFWVT